MSSPLPHVASWFKDGMLPAWIQLVDGGYVVDAPVLAAKFGLGIDELRAAMRAGRLVSRVEKGEGADEGRVRLSLRHGASVWRILIDRDGSVSEDFALGPPPRPRPAARGD